MTIHNKSTAGSAGPARAEAGRMFQLAWGFLLVTAAIGLLLRLQFVTPMEGFAYGNMLHAHSHTGFLGWVFNAFFALAWVRFVPRERRRRFLRLFMVLQAANLGMLASFPFQGYGPVSIAFSTLHSAAGAVFAIFLWSPPGAGPLCRRWLRAGLVCMLASGAGPLVLGPIAALDLRDSPFYPSAVYWYLHFQYNGWFVLFPLALAAGMDGLDPALRQAFSKAFTPLVAGVVLTFAISLLWLDPPLRVFALAGMGALLQLAGLLRLAGPAFRVLSQSGTLEGPTSRLLLRLAGTALLLKALAQLAACWPDASPFINHRYSVIAFLHWVFLLVVTPALMAAAMELRWLPDCFRVRLALVVFLAAAFYTELALVLPLWPGGGTVPPGFSSPAALAWASAVMAAGLAAATPFSALPPPDSPRLPA